MTDWMDVRVTQVRNVALDVREYTLARADGQVLPRFDAGSHIDVEAPGGPVRQYSLSSLADDAGQYRFAVKRENASRGGSQAMHERVRVGSALRIRAPRNHFALRPDEPRVLLLAGGIGVTPLLCMARQLQTEGRPFELHLFARSRDHAPYLDLLSRSDWQAHAHAHLGLDAQGTIAALHRILSAQARETGIYICGPAPFMDAAVAQAGEAGLSRVHTEYFAAPTPAPADAARAARSFQVKLCRSGVTLAVPADKSIVEVMSEHRLYADVSCEQGVCGTCLTRVVAGTPDHRDAYLSDAERAAGDQMLICVSRALGDGLELDL